MTTFSDIQHPRSSASGQFMLLAHSQPEEIVHLLDESNAPHFDEWAGGVKARLILPDGPAELRDALDVAADPCSAPTVIRISHPMAWIVDPFDGGPQNRPVLMEILTDPGPIIVKSGHAVIYVTSPRSLEVEALNDAELVVVIAPGCSAVITARDASRVRVSLGMGARGALRLASAAAFGEIDGNQTSFTRADTYLW